MRFRVSHFAAFLALLLLSIPARALITGNIGNTPVTDHNWPAGALDVANLPSRIAWWEGPPFGGGAFQFLYRGDHAALQKALDAFAKIHAPELRLVIHEGSHESFFLKTEGNPEIDAHVDWTLTVWDPSSWHQLYNNPQSLFDSDDPSGAFRKPVDPPILDVYVAATGGAGLDWTKINVPAGLAIVDARASANGCKPEDGSVILGEIYDLLTSKPIPGAHVSVVTYKPPEAWPEVAGTDADAQGHFELKNVPADGRSVRVSAKGYVGRDLGYIDLGPHGFQKFTVQLAAPATVNGIVRDTAGKPLAGVKVHPESILALDGRGYRLATPSNATTDAQGAFELSGIPQGYVQLYSSQPSYQALDIFHIYRAPTTDVALQMTATGTVKGKVLRPAVAVRGELHVAINPPGDPADSIGKWGGSMQVRPDGTFEFDNVPPGTYVITPNPDPTLGSKDPLAKTIVVKLGETTEVDLTAPPAPK